MNSKKTFLSVLVMLFVSGCVGFTPTDPPRKGFYKNEPATFNASYDEVWEATLMAVEELDWDTKTTDKTTGKIELLTSYVYNPSFGEYKRIYIEPTNEQIEDSKVKPYLRRISHFEKLTPPPAPPNPKFVMEEMKIQVVSISPSQTQVKANYKITPYHDYKIGRIGTVKSNGHLEKNLFKKTGDLLAKEDIPPAPPVPEELGLQLADIFFDFDKSNIRPDAEPVLLENADMIKNEPGITVVIEGYADIRGTDNYNLGLAQRRADAAKAYLVKLGIAAERITTISKGETSIFAAGSTEEAYQLNRRAHFIPLKPGSMPGARIFLKEDESNF